MGILLAILSGVLLALSYPVFNLELLAFVAFIPLFFSLKNKSYKKAFFLSYICGLVFFCITGYWLIHVSLAGLILLILYLALYFGIFGCLFNLLSINHKLSTINYLIVPGIWVLVELSRQRSIIGFPFMLLGYSQYLNLPIIQIADITGVWGVSFLVMTVNVAIWKLVLKVRSKEFGVRSSELGVKNNYIVSVVFSVSCLIFVLIYGYNKLATFNFQPSTFNLQTHNPQFKISLIQGSIPQNQKWDDAFKDSISERYERLTEDAAKDKPDLIIWPETSVPGIISEDPELLYRISKLAKKVNTSLLVGAVMTRPVISQIYADSVIKKRLTIINYYNSAVLISKEGSIVKQYDKLRLVPFGEYVPLEKYFPFLRRLIGVPIGDFTPGKKYTLFELRTPKSELITKFGVLICFEDIFPGMVRRFVKDGAEFMINITNDGWFTMPIDETSPTMWKKWAGFMRPSAPYQHAQASVFRAVENRIPVVRAANTGLSCFIDSSGRIYDKVMVDNKDIFVVGYKTQVVQVKK